MDKQHFTIVLLITLVIAVTVTVWGFAKSVNKDETRDLAAQLQHAQSDLDNTKLQLADAEQKLSFMEANKTGVQVTAYALTHGTIQLVIVADVVVIKITRATARLSHTLKPLNMSSCGNPFFKKSVS